LLAEHPARKRGTFADRGKKRASHPVPWRRILRQDKRLCRIEIRANLMYAFIRAGWLRLGRDRAARHHDPGD